MATEIASAYVSIYANNERLTSGLAEAKSKTESAMKTMHGNVTGYAQQSNAKQLQMYANLMQRAITVSRALRRLMMVTFAPMAAISAAAYKSFSSASTKETMTAIANFDKFKATVKGRLADAFGYALQTTKVFGKTTAQWMDVISNKMKNLTTQDVKGFITAMKLLVTGMALTKTLEMWLMLARYITLATSAVKKFAAYQAGMKGISIGGAVAEAGAGAAAGTAASKTVGTASKLLTKEAALISAIAANTVASGTNTTALYANALKTTALVPMKTTALIRNNLSNIAPKSSFNTGSYGYALETGSAASRFKARKMLDNSVYGRSFKYHFGDLPSKGEKIKIVKPRRQFFIDPASEYKAKSILPHAAQATGLSLLMANLGKFLLILGKFTIVGTVVGILGGAFAKLGGFKSLAEGFEFVATKFVGLVSIVSSVFDKITSAVAEGLITIGSIFDGFFKGKFFSEAGRKEWAKESQQAINEFRRQQKSETLPAMERIRAINPEAEIGKIKLAKEYSKDLKTYETSKSRLMDYQAGFHGQKVASRDVSDFVTAGLQSWQKGFIDNQQALYDLEESKKEQDKTFQEKMIELIKNQWTTLKDQKTQLDKLTGTVVKEATSMAYLD